MKRGNLSDSDAEERGRRFLGHAHSDPGDREAEGVGRKEVEGKGKRKGRGELQMGGNAESKLARWRRGRKMRRGRQKGPRNRKGKQRLSNNHQRKKK